MNAPLSPRPQNKDVPGTILAIVFIAMGCLAWWDTYSMSDADSYMFPRAVIATLILCCLLLIGRNLIWGGGRRQPLDGSVWRRAALVLSMLGAALAMPELGFVVVGLALFAISMFLAMFEPWTRKKAILYPLIGIGIVVMFYILFALLLNVTLPTGAIFS